MPDYSVVATVLETRVYQVLADSADEAEELVRSEYNDRQFDLMDEELDDVTVEE